jgi:hypothetical protein
MDSPEAVICHRLVADVRRLFLKRRLATAGTEPVNASLGRDAMRDGRCFYFCAFGLLLGACGGSVGTTSGAGGDAGTSEDAGATTDSGAPRDSGATGDSGAMGDSSMIPVVRDAATLAEAGPDAGAYGPSDAGVADDAEVAACACSYATQYCEVSYGEPLPDGGDTVSEVCLPFSDCEGGASCDCIKLNPFCYCEEDAGDVTEICPFHV